MLFCAAIINIDGLSLDAFNLFVHHLQFQIRRSLFVFHNNKKSKMLKKDSLPHFFRIIKQMVFTLVVFNNCLLLLFAKSGNFILFRALLHSVFFLQLIFFKRWINATLRVIVMKTPKSNRNYFLWIYNYSNAHTN